LGDDAEDDVEAPENVTQAAVILQGHEEAFSIGEN